MKKTFITIALFLALAVVAGAQERKQNGYTRQGNTFVQDSARKAENSDQSTTYTWRDSKGNEYPIVLHTYTKGEKAGRVTAYVIRVSAKTGKEYKYYLPNGEEIAKEIINENK